VDVVRRRHAEYPDAEIRLQQGALTRVRKNTGVVPLLALEGHGVLRQLVRPVDFRGLAAPQAARSTCAESWATTSRRISQSQAGTHPRRRYGQRRFVHVCTLRLGRARADVEFPIAVDWYCDGLTGLTLVQVDSPRANASCRELSRLFSR